MRTALITLAVCGFVGCTGTITGLEGGTPERPADDATRPQSTLRCADPAEQARTPMWSPARLTTSQYRAAVASVFGASVANVALVENGPTDLPSVLAVEQYLAAAESVASKVDLTRSGAVLGCATTQTDAQCIEAAVEKLGLQLFRRPVSATERARFGTLFTDARAQFVTHFPTASTAERFEAGARAVLEALLLSPEFLFREETGVADPALPTAVRALSGHDVAARLSFFLVDAPPDAELLALASAGGLETDVQVRAVAKQLLQSDRAKQRLLTFFENYVGLNGGHGHGTLEEETKSNTVYLDFDDQEAAAMRAELREVVSQVLFEEDARLSTLMTTRHGYVNKTLAQLYQLPNAPANDTTFVRVEHDAARRSGLLTLAGVMTLYASADFQSPIHRGTLLLDLLGLRPPPPPPEVSNVMAGGAGLVAGAARSTRHAVEAQTSSAACAGCHATINPAGFLFENYDAVGRWQLTEAVRGEGSAVITVPIDATGQVPLIGLTGAANAVDAMPRIANDPALQNELSRRLLELALSKKVSPGVSNADACVLAPLAEAFHQNDDILAQLATMAASDALRFTRLPAETAP